MINIDKLLSYSYYDLSAPEFIISDIYKDMGNKLTFPINVEDIVSEAGFLLHEDKEIISDSVIMYYADKKRGEIAVSNRIEDNAKRRFIIARLLGSFLLQYHYKREDFFIDIYDDDQVKDSDILWANRFAATLFAQNKVFLRAKSILHRKGYKNDELYNELANFFDVTPDLAILMDYEQIGYSSGVDFDSSNKKAKSSANKKLIKTLFN